ncbi:hypothetical protein B0H11DRAFT_1905299 [Mycena galericulata]|nr:hypothetical protein B0H11DRAFT_1905299 [Mycena galericulata]
MCIRTAIGTLILSYGVAQDKAVISHSNWVFKLSTRSGPSSSERSESESAPSSAEFSIDFQSDSESDKVQGQAVQIQGRSEEIWPRNRVPLAIRAQSDQAEKGKMKQLLKSQRQSETTVKSGPAEGLNDMTQTEFQTQPT